MTMLEERDEPRFCASCGASLATGARFCNSCGKLVLRDDVGASLWRRSFAYAADLIIISLTVGVGWLVWFFFTAQAATTPGKALLGIRVIRADGSPVQASAMWEREVLFKVIMYGLASVIIIVSWLVVYAFARAFWDREKQAWHDKSLNMYVVNAPYGGVKAMFSPLASSR